MDFDGGDGLTEQSSPMGNGSSPLLLEAINGLMTQVKSLAEKKAEKKPLQCPPGLKNKRNERVIKIFNMLQRLLLLLRGGPFELLADVLGALAESYKEYDQHADFARLDGTISEHLQEIVPEHSRDLVKMLRMSPAAKRPQQRRPSWDRQDLQYRPSQLPYAQLPSRRSFFGQQLALERQLQELRSRPSMEFYPALEQKQLYEEQQGPCVRDVRPSGSRSLVPAQGGKLTVVHEGQVNAHGHCTFCTNAGRPNPAQCHFLKRHPSATSTWCAAT